jgi:SPP1 gp7 family putative phage head morphogenesis protein
MPSLPAKPLAASFDLEPEEAVAFFQGKGLATTFDWRDMLRHEHNKAFTVAKLMQSSLLEDVRAATDAALKRGLTFQQFRDSIEPTLVKAGWWGKAELIDPATGEKKLVQLGSVQRLRTIYQTNMATAIAHADWERIEKTHRALPYLMYNALDYGPNRRPEHQRWDGLILRWDDPWLGPHFPPNGWGCKCSMSQLTERAAQRILSDRGDRGRPLMNSAPDDGTYEWRNPRTGKTISIPKGIDPGWDYNIGKDSVAKLKEALEERTAAVGRIKLPKKAKAATSEPTPIRLNTFEGMVQRGRKFAKSLGFDQVKISKKVARFAEVGRRLKASGDQAVTGRARTKLLAELYILDSQGYAKPGINALHKNLTSRPVSQESRDFLNGISIDFDDSVAARIRSALGDFMSITGGAPMGDLKSIRSLSGKRPFAAKDSGVLNLGGDGASFSTSTLFHEMGHFVEFGNDDFLLAADDFVSKTATVRGASLGDLFPGRGYREDEFVDYSEKYIHPYVGKRYYSGFDDEKKFATSTEVISMGLEYFIDEMAMIELFKKDPEHFNFILGVISGQ